MSQEFVLMLFSSAECACAESAIRYCLDHIFDHFIVLCAKLVFFDRRFLLVTKKKNWSSMHDEINGALTFFG